MVLVENKLDIETYLSLREQVNWKKLTGEQAKKAIEGSLYLVVAYENDRAIGMGRLVGDGAVICYIQDLIVVPGCQGKGVGKEIINHLIGYAKKTQLPGTEMMLDLMCAKGREQFYARYGFIARPTETLGPGMIQYLRKD